MRRFSSTVSWPKIIRPSGTWATPRATILCARSALTDSPSSRTSPAVIRPWCSAQQPAGGADRRRLAGAVGAQQRDRLAGGQRERDAAQRGRARRRRRPRARGSPAARRRPLGGAGPASRSCTATSSPRSWPPTQMPFRPAGLNIRIRMISRPRMIDTVCERYLSSRSPTTGVPRGRPTATSVCSTCGSSCHTIAPSTAPSSEPMPPMMIIAKKSIAKPSV